MYAQYLVRMSTTSKMFERTWSVLCSAQCLVFYDSSFWRHNSGVGPGVRFSTAPYQNRGNCTSCSYCWRSLHTEESEGSIKKVHQCPHLFLSPHAPHSCSTVLKTDVKSQQNEIKLWGQWMVVLHSDTVVEFQRETAKINIRKTKFYKTRSRDRRHRNGRQRT